MSDIDYSQFYSGGFFLIRTIDTPEGLDWDGILPEKILSLSRCFCDRFDNTWTWKSDGRVDKEPARAFGVDIGQWDSFVEWCDIAYREAQLDMYGVFLSKTIAQDCVKRFIQARDNLYLIEVGLPAYIGQYGWREQFPDDGHKVGIEKRISGQESLLLDGPMIGFEVLSYAYHDFSHSWLCSLIHHDMYELYGIKPNEYGLIENFEDAKKVYEWIAEDEMRGRRGEPEPYDFWLLVSHSLEEEIENPSSA